MGSKLLAFAKETKRLKVFLALTVALCALFAQPVPAHSQSNAPPAFPFTTAVRFIAENSAPPIPVGFPIVATDQDPQDQLTYSLSGQDADLFNIVNTTGQLEAVQPLDYESGSSYSVTVQATDSAGLYDTVSVTVEVTNVDETGKIVLSRETDTTTPELKAVLTDPDGNISDVSWQWAVSIDKADWKDIQWAQGASYSPSTEELRQFLRVQARYTDGHGAGKVATTLFEIDPWSPQINHLPEFPFSESGVRTVSADAPLGQPIGHPVLASDLDRDVLTYWLSGDASQYFAIGPETGQLRTKSSLGSGYEGKHFGVVHVLDGRGGSASKTVRIDVGNVNAPAAITDNPAFAVSVTQTTAYSPPAPTVSDPGPNQAVVSTTHQKDPLQTSAAVQENAPISETSAEPELSLGQAVRTTPSLPAAAGVPVNSETAADSNQGTESDHDVIPAIAAVNPPPSLSAEAGAGANPAGPAGGAIAEARSEGTGFGSPLGWLAGIFVALILLAAGLVVLSRKVRSKEGEVVLPPPTVGPERRIGPLPVLLSRAGEDERPNVSTGLVNANPAERP